MMEGSVEVQMYDAVFRKEGPLGMKLASAIPPLLVPEELGGDGVRARLAARVSQVHSGSNASEAGIAAGSVILAVEGVRMDGLRYSDVLAKIKVAAKERPFTLTLLSPDSGLAPASGSKPRGMIDADAHGASTPRLSASASASPFSGTPAMSAERSDPSPARSASTSNIRAAADTPNSQIIEMRKRLDAAEGRVQELDSQVVALREDLDLEKEMHVNDVAALQEALADAEEVRSATSEDLATLRSENASLRTELEEVNSGQRSSAETVDQEQHDRLQKTARLLKHDLAEARQKFQTASTKASKAQEEVKLLRGELTAMRDRNQALEKTGEEAAIKAQSAESKLAALEVELTKARARGDALDLLQTSHEEKAKEHETAMEELEKLREESRLWREKASKESESKISEMQKGRSLTAELEAAREKLVHAQGEIQSLRAEREKAHGSAETIRAEFEGVEAELKQALKISEATVQTLQRAEQGREEEKREQDELYKNRLDELRSKLSDAESTRDAAEEGRLALE
eukprot:g4820.t1